MPAFLREQLEHFGDKVHQERLSSDREWATLCEDIAEMTALAVHLLERIEMAAARTEGAEKMVSGGGLVPLFQSWLRCADEVNELRRACRERGSQLKERILSCTASIEPGWWRATRRQSWRLLTEWHAASGAAGIWTR